MSFDIVTIGSAVLDVLLRSSQFSSHQVAGELMLCEISGGKVDVEEAMLCSGGAGTNTAVSFARQGFHTGIVAEIGIDAPAQLIIDELQREQVDTSLIIEEAEEQTGMSAILVASDGSRSAMTFRGAAKQLSHKDIPFTVLEQVSAIHLSSIGNADLVREIALFSKEKGIHLSWNPSAAELKDVVLQSSESLHQSIQVVCVNDLEYEEIQDHQGSLSKIASTIIVTKGRDGGEVLANGSKHPYLAKPVIAVSELGAGDAFISGFVGATLLKQSIEEAILRGTQNAASVVQHLGAKKGLLSFSS